MARVSTYLNFPGTTEKAFTFYRDVVGGEFIGGIHRFGEAPTTPGQPPLSETDKNLVILDRFVAADDREAWPDHAIFGSMSRQSWGRFSHRHFDHHLRQFGV